MHVVMQSGPFRIRYHVQDGGSTDGTIQKLEAWKQRLATNSLPIFCEAIDFSFTSEPDGSMYEAVTKGFEHLSEAPDDAFLTWINFDDLLLPGACALAASLDQELSSSEVSWFTGIHNHTDEAGRPTRFSSPPLPQDLIACGAADTMLMTTIQQEGTFFRKWLWDAVDKNEAFSGLKLAGDWNLWRLMAQHAPLHQLLGIMTGRYSKREGQLSNNLEAYLSEVDKIYSKADRISGFETRLKLGNISTPSIWLDRQANKFKLVKRAVSQADLLSVAVKQVPELENCLEQDRVSQDKTQKTPEKTESDKSPEQVKDALRRLQQFELFSPNRIRKLAAGAPPDELDWRKSFLKAPHKISKWSAIRRAQKRLRQT